LREFFSSASYNYGTPTHLRHTIICCSENADICAVSEIVEGSNNCI